MLINVSYDQNAGALPTGFTAAIAAVVQFYDTTFTNPITVNLNVGFGEVGGTRLASGALGESSESYITTNYSQLRSAFISNAASGDSQTAAASLPVSDPTNGGHFIVTQAEAAALGLLPAGVTATGSVGFSTTATFDYAADNTSTSVPAGQYDFFAVAAHEISEVLGRVVGVGQTIPGVGKAYYPLDLFHYSAAGVRDFSGTTAGYFSPDGGATNLGSFNTSSGGDFGDWASSVGNNAYDAFTSSGVVNPVTASDLREMNVLGYSLATAAQTIGSTIDNSTPNAVIVGTASSDTIDALGGNATVTGGAGNDTIVGGAGLNTSIYMGSSRDYAVTVTAGATALTVQDKVGTDGTDTLTNFQKLQFTDQTIDTTWFTNTAGLSASQITGLTELYIATFNRAPDALGLDYWGSQLSSGMSLEAIAASFFVQQEAAAAYPAGQSTQAFVNQVYGNVLGRQADAAGLDYWVSQLQTGGVSKNSFLLAIINGVIGTDVQYLANREAVGAHFALTLGLSDVTWAKAVMSGVDGTAASATVANAQTDAHAASAATTADTELVVKILGIVA